MSFKLDLLKELFKDLTLSCSAGFSFSKNQHSRVNLCKSIYYPSRLKGIKLQMIDIQITEVAFQGSWWSSSPKILLQLNHFKESDFLGPVPQFICTPTVIFSCPWPEKRVEQEHIVERQEQKSRRGIIGTTLDSCPPPGPDSHWGQTEPPYLGTVKNRIPQLRNSGHITQCYYLCITANLNSTLEFRVCTFPTVN